MNEIKKANKRNPRVLLPLGTLVSSMGGGMYTLAVGKLLYDKTGATSSFAFILILETILAFSTQAFASIVSDRGKAKQSAFIADFIRGFGVTACGIIALMGYPIGIVFATFIINLLKPFYRTATFKMGPMIAEGQNLARYNGRISACSQMGQLIGAAVSGIIITFFSAYLAIILNGVSYIISAICISIAKIPNQNTFTKEGFCIKKIIGGFKVRELYVEWNDLIKYVVKTPTLLWLLILCTTDFIICSFINISYAPLLQMSNSANWWISVWDCAYAIGAILGALIYGRLKNFNIPVNIISICVFTQGLAIIGVNFHSAIIVTLSMFVVGITNIISFSGFNYSLQNISLKGFHGRIAGIKQLFISGATTVIVPIISFSLNYSILIATTVIFVICSVSCLLTLIKLKPLMCEGGKK